MRPSASSLLLLALAAGCGDSGTSVLITVDATTPLTVGRLHLDATAGGMTRGYDVTTAAIPPAVTILLKVPPSVKGRMDLAVTAFDAGGAPLATASGSVELAAGQAVDVSLTLGAPNSDAAMPGDAARSGDLASSSRGDLSQDDLSQDDLSQGDLQPLPDLSQPSLVILPSSHAFGALNAGTATSPQPFTVQNTGAASGPLTVQVIGTDAAELTVDPTGCNGLVLAPLATCMVTVSFHPANAGPRSATLQASDGTRSGTATLTGQAVGINGKACGTVADCQSGNCTDGYCCDQSATDCSGCNACNVAGQEGTCSAVLAGDDPHTTCATGCFDKCNGAGACRPATAGTDPHGVCTQPCADQCDGAGACRPAVAGTACGPPGTTCTNSSTFMGQVGSAGFTDPVCPGNALTCSTGPRACPNGTICGASGCKATCANDLDCTAGLWCDQSGNCRSPQTAGMFCLNWRGCQTHMCEASVCQSGCYGAAMDSGSHSSPAWSDPFSVPCFGANGVNQFNGCTASGVPANACAVSRLGICNASNGFCLCSSDSDCTDPTAPYCMAATFGATGNMCGCWSWNTSGSSFESVRCSYGQTCMVPKNTIAASRPDNVCLTRAGYPCSSSSECASNNCVSGTCN